MAAALLCINRERDDEYRFIIPMMTGLTYERKLAIKKKLIPTPPERKTDDRRNVVIIARLHNRERENDAVIFRLRVWCSVNNIRAFFVVFVSST